MKNRTQGVGQPVTKEKTVPVFIRAFALPEAEVSKRFEISSFFKWLRSGSACRGASPCENDARPEGRSRRRDRPSGPLSRSLAFVTMFTFLANQVCFAQAGVYGPAELRTAQPAIAIPEKRPDESDVTPGPSAALDFLASDVSPLTLMDKKAEEEQNGLDHDYERYDFDRAVELIRKEFASAVIINDLTAEDIKRLAELPVETGVIVLRGETVLFTSGSADGIEVLPAARELFEKAVFVSHTHTGALSAQGPSGADLNAAGERAEYVITPDRVYAYDQTGVLDEEMALGYEEYLAQLNAVLAVTRYERDQVGARKDLNRFIAAQDEYNRARADEREALRMGGTISSTPGLKSSSVTAMPGSPLPYITAGSSTATSLSYAAAANEFALK